MVPPPDYASIDEALQLGIIAKLGPPPTAKVEPTVKKKEKGTPIYYLYKLLEDGRLTDCQRKELLAKGRTGPYTAASLYDDHLSLGPHLRQFYEREPFLLYYNQRRPLWRNKYYPQAAAEDEEAAGRQGGNNWNGNSGVIVPVANRGSNHQVGYGRGGGGGPGGHQGWNGNQGFNQQGVLGQGLGGGSGGSAININITLPQPQYQYQYPPYYSSMMAPMAPYQYHPHPHHYYSNHVSYVHNVAGVNNATSYDNDGISTFSEEDATVARRGNGNGNDETTTFSTTTIMQQRHDGTAAVSSLAAMAGGSSNNCGDGGSSSRGESFSSYSSVQTASKAPAKQSTTSTTTSSPKRTDRSDGVINLMSPLLTPNNYQPAGFRTTNQMMPSHSTSNANQLTARFPTTTTYPSSQPQWSPNTNTYIASQFGSAQKPADNEASMDIFDVSPFADIRLEELLSEKDVDYLIASESGNSAKWSAERDMTPIDKWDDCMSSTFDTQLSENTVPILSRNVSARQNAVRRSARVRDKAKAT